MGESICRFKIYKPSEETFFEDIFRPHCEEAWKLLENVDLAHKDDQMIYRCTEELGAGRYNYAADYGEKFSPAVPCIFTLLKNSPIDTIIQTNGLRH